MARTMIALAAACLALGLATDALAKGSDSGGPAQPAQKKLTKEEELMQFLQELGAKRSSQTEKEAISSVRKLIVYWRDTRVSDQSKKSIPRLVEGYARDKATPVALAGISGLADIGKGEGTERLVHVIDALSVQAEPPADRLGAAFGGLRSAADTDLNVTGPLLKYLGSKSKAVVAGAIDALSGYGNAPPGVRSKLFEASLTSFESMAGAAARGDEKDSAARWTAVQQAAVLELNALARQQFADVPAARKWFNENRGKSGTWK